MDTLTLQHLLKQKEGPNLEFKAQFHQIFAEDGETKKRQRHELVKDILSLANGSASVAGEPAYLIFGAEDKLGSDGQRKLHDLSQHKLPSVAGLLGIVNALCDPPIDNLYCDLIAVEGKRLFVVTIPPTAQLYETSDRLETPTQTYSKHVVFIRHNETIDIASSKQRIAILELKRIRIMESRHTPLKFAPHVGMYFGYALGSIAAEKHTNDIMADASWGGIIGAILGTLFGVSIGYFYENFDDVELIKTDSNTTKLAKIGWIPTTLMLIMMLWRVSNDLVARLYKYIQPVETESHYQRRKSKKAVPGNEPVHRH